MTEPLADTPAAIVILHLVALAALLIYGIVTRLRRFVLIRQSRNPPSAVWFRLLHLLLGLPK